MARQARSASPIYSPDLFDALGNPTRIELLFRLAADEETVPSLTESMEPNIALVRYHLVDVLCHQLGFVREVGPRQIRGVDGTSYGIDWLRVNGAITWPSERSEPSKHHASLAFDGVVDECIGLLERGALEFRHEVVLAWYRARLGELDGRPVRDLLAAAQEQLQIAAMPGAPRVEQRNGIRAAILATTFGTPAARRSTR